MVVCYPKQVWDLWFEVKPYLELHKDPVDFIPDTPEKIKKKRKELKRLIREAEAPEGYDRYGNPINPDGTVWGWHGKTDCPDK